MAVKVTVARKNFPHHFLLAMHDKKDYEILFADDITEKFSSGSPTEINLNDMRC